MNVRREPGESEFFGDVPRGVHHVVYGSSGDVVWDFCIEMHGPHPSVRFDSSRDLMVDHFIGFVIDLGPFESDAVHVLGRYLLRHSTKTSEYISRRETTSVTRDGSWSVFPNASFCARIPG